MGIAGDEHLSALTYDDKYTPRSILLATRGDGEILVELLLGFSVKNPLFMLSVCQKFAEGLIEQNLKEEYPTISMLTLNENVVPLIRRLLDKEYEIKTRAKILHAEKCPEDRGTEIAELEEAAGAEESPEGFMIQNNINEKYTWYMDKKKE